MGADDTCGFCGNPTTGPGWCDPCAEAPKCDACGDPCVDGYADKENSLCEWCLEKSQRAEREAAQREFDRREGALDDLRDRIKDERRPVDAAIRALVDR